MGPRPAVPPAGIHGVLSVLADLADRVREAVGHRRPPEHLRWLPVGLVGPLLSTGRAGIPGDHRSRTVVATLAAIDAIRPGEDTLRAGWLWAVGTPEGGRPIAEPLVDLAVRVDGDLLVAAGEPSLPAAVADPGERARLELGWQAALDPRLADPSPVVPALLLPHLSRLASWARQVAAAAGLDVPPLQPAHGLVPPDGTIGWLAGQPGLRIVVGLGLYATAVTPDLSPAGSLRRWHDAVGTSWTALHALYLDRPPPPARWVPDVPSAFRLTTAQQAAVAAARTEPVTVIAGAPGTGKTHTIAAIVHDVVARGGTVLVAARSASTADAVVELLARRPGPAPAVFGAGDRRLALADELAAGRPAPVAGAEVERRLQAARAAVRDRDALWARTAEVLEGLALLDRPAQAAALREVAPGLLRPEVSLEEVLRLARDLPARPAEDPPWWARSRRRRRGRLAALLGADGATTSGEVRAAVALARATRALHAAQRGAADGVLPWADLADAQAAVEQAAGEWVDAAGHDERRVTREVRQARAALATALRAGRHTRRARLAELGAAAARALPVWVGTLGDVDDLLPAVPAAFDVVVLDEASSIDQPRAAPALLRGRRAVVVGDPRQLRHVSFTADAEVATAIARHLPGAPPTLAARLDVRRASVFDVAAGGASVHWLDEHFRGGAHLFAFVGRRLYGGRVRVATTTPATDEADQIRLTRLDGAAGALRDDGKVVRAEVDHVLARLQVLAREGCRSVGVVSPFRPQADAIEAAALEALGLEGVTALGLRVGTVHAFQGMERDVVIVSLGIGADDGPATWRFADDPGLVAVMATRARRRIEWVVSAEPPPGSLIGDYLRQVDDPPVPPRGIELVGGWGQELAGRLAAAGVEVTAPYPAGGHHVDVCAHDGDRFVGVEAALHPEGPHAHVRRHLELRAAGWPLVTALPAEWGDRPAELVLQVRDALRRAP